MRLSTVLILASLGACALPPPPPPAAEFLVSAGDQTYWVRSDNSGLRVRGSPLILARTGGRYYEIFVGEVDRSFPKALLSGERVFRRDLTTGDSTMIYDDTAVVRLAEQYHRQHPTARPLGPDDDPDDNVDITGVGETDILNVLGPYIALEHRLSVIPVRPKPWAMFDSGEACWKSEEEFEMAVKRSGAYRANELIKEHLQGSSDEDQRLLYERLKRKLRNDHVSGRLGLRRSDGTRDA